MSQHRLLQISSEAPTSAISPLKATKIPSMFRYVSSGVNNLDTGSRPVAPSIHRCFLHLFDFVQTSIIHPACLTILTPQEIHMQPAFRPPGNPVFRSRVAPLARTMPLQAEFSSATLPLARSDRMSSVASRLLLPAVIAMSLLGCGAAAAEAPRELFNKTISISWNEYRVQRADSGEIKKGNTSSTLLVYVGESGRLFTRLSRQGGNKSNSNDLDPEGGNQRSGVGAAGNLSTSFEGRQLLVSNSMSSGARRIQATFNPAFTGCGAQIRFGKEGGSEIRHRAMDGRMYNIISTDVSGQSCSVRAGNVFAVR